MFKTIKICKHVWEFKNKEKDGDEMIVVWKCSKCGEEQKDNRNI